MYVRRRGCIRIRILLLMTPLIVIACGGSESTTAEDSAVSLYPSISRSVLLPSAVRPFDQLPRVDVGASELTLVSIMVVGGAASVFSQTNSCAIAIAPGGTCSILASFAPTSAGVMDDSLRMQSNQGRVYVVALSGSGQVGAENTFGSARFGAATLQ